MGTMWVITANSSYAKIFEVKGHGKQIKEVLQFDFPTGRMKGSDILSDRPGRAFDRQGVARHALGTEIDVHTHEQQVFASKLAHVLYENKVNGVYDELALVAPPQFLGELKQALDAQVFKSVVKEINKDLPSHLSEKEVLDHLVKYLDLWNH